MVFRSLEAPLLVYLFWATRLGVYSNERPTINRDCGEISRMRLPINLDTSGRGDVEVPLIPKFKLCPSGDCIVKNCPRSVENSCLWCTKVFSSRSAIMFEQA